MKVTIRFFILTHLYCFGYQLENDGFLWYIIKLLPLKLFSLQTILFRLFFFLNFILNITCLLKSSNKTFLIEFVTIFFLMSSYMKSCHLHFTLNFHYLSMAIQTIDIILELLQKLSIDQIVR